MPSFLKMTADTAMVGAARGVTRYDTLLIDDSYLAGFG
jgi:hypothetical protein